MDITNLEFECDSKGNPKVSVWAKCHSREDIEDIIAWLHLAKDMMTRWEKIRSRREGSSHAPKASSGKNENPKQGEIQSKPLSERRQDGKQQAVATPHTEAGA